MLGATNKIHMDEKTRNVVTKHEPETGKKIENVNYDQVIESAGEFGKYQVYLFFYVFPFYIFAIFGYFSQEFVTDVAPQHWCWIPELENLTDVQRRELAIPKDEHNSLYGYSRCLSYEANWTEILATGARPDETWKTVPCENGWEFNKTEFPYISKSSDLGWVCDKDEYQATGKSLFSVGLIIGGLLIGWIADRFGRLPAAVFSNVIGVCAGTASVFANNFIQFAIYRFIMGMSYNTCIMMVYLLVLEYTSPRYRSVITNMSLAVFLTITAVALPCIAMACGDWQAVGLVTSLPMSLSILAPLIINESPRWLLSKGRVDDAISRILRIAAINKKEVPQDMVANFKHNILKNKEARGSVLDLIKMPLLRRMFICICIEMMCCLIIYYSSARTMRQLQFDVFLSFSVISFTEVPSLMVISFGIDYTGRKLMIITVMTISAVSSFMIVFVDDGLASVACAVVVRFAMSMACNIIMQWSAEMLPTSVRGTGIAIIHIFGYLAGMMAPYVIDLETYMAGLSAFVFGIIGILGAMIGFMLPETTGKEMPATYEAAEALIQYQGLIELPFLQKKKSGSFGPAA